MFISQQEVVELLFLTIKLRILRNTSLMLAINGPTYAFQCQNLIRLIIKWLSEFEKLKSNHKSCFQCIQLIINITTRIQCFQSNPK